ncbi:MAG: phosphate acyltransferase PlsX [Candidatus Cloacimonetes bacterium]|nr:phosphate acyltransferase PlsX [Candidatus Cloacimonadota bacterium]MCF7815111.1 phosphate acyltransferase PlsX [Candidatus Cloacimonadota bacterium]MCF7868610.1 phosphate acyltransferase PlsX [Candidatus Cloacimonadota bacterium]MCF7882839.1 phosphate acyltransferase PlsX [Candidatus Cloacimonadota bacterium]
MRIAIDAFGSDSAPSPEVEGAILAIKEGICDKIFLVGKQEILNKELEKYYYEKDKIEVVNATETISMHDSPASIVKKKQDSSLVQAIKLCKDGEADGMTSAGNTGAVMAAALFGLGRIKNVLRPAIATAFPTQNHPEIILDVGANVDCSAENLMQFARLGQLYSRFFFKISDPKVALLNIGEEITKGSELYKTVHQQLLEAEDINFVGNIEGKDLLKGIVDVVVCDGFVGNVMLKTVEGAAYSIFSIMKEQIKKDWIAKLGALLSFPVYAYLKKKLDHTEYGGALLVGLNGIAVVSHGRSNGTAIKNAVKVAAKMAESGFVSHAKEYYENL